MKKTNILLLTTLAFSTASHANLLGTELSIQVDFQGSPTQTPATLGLLTTATVTEPGVEFPSLQSTATSNNLGLNVVDVAINAGSNFLEIYFDNTQFSSFTPAFFNGYVFTFENTGSVTFTDASIDTSVTTLGLTASDLSILGNQLFVNVESLPFNQSTFARINLDTTVTSTPSAIPVPAALPLMASALGMFGIAKRRKKQAA